MTVEKLIEFENKIGDMFNNKLIKAPIHLYNGNEEKMIDKELKEIVEYYKQKFIW